MKIKAKNSKIASMKLIVPVDGEISIDGDGVADVSGKCAVALVTGTSDWEYVGKKKTVEVEDIDNDLEDDDDDDGEGEESEREKFEAHIDTLKLKELKSLAEEGEMPKEEWEKLNSKELMKAYLLKKYDEAETEGTEEDDDDDDGEGEE